MNRQENEVCVVNKSVAIGYHTPFCETEQCGFEATPCHLESKTNVLRNRHDISKQNENVADEILTKIIISKFLCVVLK